MAMPIVLTLVWSLLAASLAAQAAPRTRPATPPAPRLGDWTTAAHDAGGTRHSPLEQITPANVDQLREVHRIATGSSGPHEGAPLVVNGVMYLHTPFPNRVMAVDLAAAGRVLWTWTAPAIQAPPLTAGRDVGSRGLAFHPSGIVFVPVLPGDLAALDARTGREIWRVRNADARAGATMSSAPIVAGDIVVVGMAGSEYGVRGYLTAYQADNGRLLWRGYTTGPDSEVLLNGPASQQYPSHSGRNLGTTTWPGTAWRTGGGTTNGWLTWDPGLQLVFHGTGAPAPWQALLRPGDSKWTSAVMARDLATGAVRWAYQFTPGDAWGYGAEGENILTDLTIGGQAVKALVHVNRNGFVYTLDRRSGRLLVVERAGPTNWITRMDAATGVPARDPRFVPGATGVTRGICPATVGLKGAAPAAFSPVTGLVFAPLTNLCMEVRPAAPRMEPGQPYLGATWRLTAGPGASRGRFVAWDPSLGAIRWEIGEPFPVLGGALSVASGLVFYATADGWLKAVDQLTGRERWRHQLPAGSVGSPMTYLGPDGRQYLALLVGPGGWPAIDDFDALPDLPWTPATPGLLLVFALPDNIGG